MRPSRAASAQPDGLSLGPKVCPTGPSAQRFPSSDVSDTPTEDPVAGNCLSNKSQAAEKRDVPAAWAAVTI
jgi:hypothetical protein